MYVTNQRGNTVIVIDTNTNMIIDTIPIGNYPIGIAYDPEKHRMYVANTNFGSPLVLLYL